MLFRHRDDNKKYSIYLTNFEIDNLLNELEIEAVDLSYKSNAELISDFEEDMLNYLNEL